MEKEFIYQVFGSGDSTDLDCMVILNDIPTKNNDRRSIGYRKSIQKSHDLCDYYGGLIKELTNTDKVVNVNICSLKNGYVYKTFKGQNDEVNNSMFLTYNLHKQEHSLQIEGLIDRDVELKILRTCRVLLSFWSRTKYRPQVKAALRGDIYQKIECIRNLDLIDIDLGKGNDLDYSKTMAFQLGQTMGLISGMEFYSKKDIGTFYTPLQPLLNRELRDDKVIQHFVQSFIKMIEFRKFDRIIE